VKKYQYCNFLSNLVNI